jgi:hypothetical protein
VARAPAPVGSATPDPWQGLIYILSEGTEFHGRNRALKELMFSAPDGRDWVDRVPYSGISQSGNQRDTSSSNGSSFPTWDFSRSSRSLSRALSPFAGTNG